MIGRTLGGATVAILQGMIVVVICLMAGFHPKNFSSLPLALLFMVLIAVMFTALGTAIASVLSDFQGFQFVMNFLVMPIFFLSGALVSAHGRAQGDRIPGEHQSSLLWNRRFTNRPDRE